jgi:hypothetical protein
MPIIVAPEVDAAIVPQIRRFERIARAYTAEYTFPTPLGTEKQKETFRRRDVFFCFFRQSLAL